MKYRYSAAMREALRSADNKPMAAIHNDAFDNPEVATASIAYIQRSVPCVNALDGIDDPVATLAEVRRLLTAALGSLANTTRMMQDGDGEDIDAAEHATRAALALLTPKL